MLRWSFILMVAFALAGAGCFESNPQPSPGGGGGGGGPGEDTTGGLQKRSPQVDEELLLASAAANDGTVVLVGLDGCAEDADYADAVPGGENSGDDGDVTSAGGGFGIDEHGGFGGVIPTVGGATEIVVYFHFGPDFEPPVLEVVVPIPVLAAEDDHRTPWFANADAEYDPDQGAGAPPEEVWDGFSDDDGLGGIEVVLEGEAAVVTGLPWTTTPLSIVAVVNQATFVQASADADTTGSFVVTIPAAAGDALLIYAVNPTDKAKATAPTTVAVP